ncbi:CNH domain-containing protein [Gongronella butleri]|nr:CNH domain-containing protein [Gongronella butleri]
MTTETATSMRTTHLTPSASIRDQYYRKHGISPRAAAAAAANGGSSGSAASSDAPSLPLVDTGGDLRASFDYSLHDEGDDDDNIFDYRPEGAIAFAPLKGPDLRLKTEDASLFSMHTEYDTDDDTTNQSICSTQTFDSLHRGAPSKKSFSLLRRQQSSQALVSMANQQQQQQQQSIKKSASEKTSLLSKLSKTTAPMRARISAMSRTNFLKTEMMSSLSIPLRRSAESVYNLPTTAALRITGRRSQGERAQSFTFEKSVRHTNQLARDALKDAHPAVYVALLSNVSAAFKERISVGTKIKDGIKYKDTFDGVEAVDKLAALIKTKDRNLALLLGRALDSQKLFHDVNYEHRLRDSRTELYRFTESFNLSHYLSGSSDSSSTFATINEDSPTDSAPSSPTLHENQAPHGVFTLLTGCYSPTCTRDRLCYSVFCPRRLEQEEDRLWVKTVPKSVVERLDANERKRQENIFELIYTEKDFVDDLAYVDKHWIQPLLTQDIIQPPERRRPFVRDVFWNIQELQGVNQRLLKALQQRQKRNRVVDSIGDILLEHAAHFAPFVKYGAHQIIAKSCFETEKSTNPAFTRFVQTTERLPVSRKLELNGYLTKPTTRLGRYNLLLREILKHTPKGHTDQETLPKTMKIIAEHLSNVNNETGKTENRFNLRLLSDKLQDSPFLGDVRLELMHEDRQIIMKGPMKKKGTGSEAMPLQVYLLDHYLLVTKSKVVNNVEQIKLVRKPIPVMFLSLSLPDLEKRAAPPSAPDALASGGLAFNPMSSQASLHSLSGPTPHQAGKNGYPINFVHLGRNGGSPTTLYATTATSRHQWLQRIEAYRYAITEKHKVFDLVPVNKDFFNSLNKVNCAATFGESILIGSDQGVYLISGNKVSSKVTRLLPLQKVSQIDTLESKFVLALADKTLYTYAVDSLLGDDQAIEKTTGVSEDGADATTTTQEMHAASSRSPAPTDASNGDYHDTGDDDKQQQSSQLRRGRKISTHVSFFKVGRVMEKMAGQDPREKSLVCYVRYNAMSSTIRALEVHQSATPKSKTKKSLRRKTTKQLGTLLRQHHEGLRVYKDLYIPGEATSIQYFKNVLCVGSEKGFQMVDVASAGVQSVLDPCDESHNALTTRYDLRPISMFRHPNGDILLCYNSLAFYIDKKGRRSRPDWLIQWEGHPTAFAFRYPYIIAFDANFIEIRDIDSGKIVQVIHGNEIRCLKPDPLDTIYCVMQDDKTGNEWIFQLKYIEK